MRRARPEALLQQSVVELLTLTAGPHTLALSIPNERECTSRNNGRPQKAWSASRRR